VDSRDYSTRDNGLFAASEQLPCDDMVTWCGTAVRSNGVEVSFNKSNWKKNDDAASNSRVGSY